MTDAMVTPIRQKAPQWGFSDRVRKVRRDILDINQAQLAAQLEVTSAAVEGWESGRNTPHDITDIAEKLERITGVHRTWFLGWVNDDIAPNPPAQDYKAASSGNVTHVDFSSSSPKTRVS